MDNTKEDLPFYRMMTKRVTRKENTQEDYILLQNDGRKEKQDDYPTFAAYIADIE